MMRMATKAKQRASNKAQLDSPSYQLPALDQDFLLGDSMRGVRFLLEYAKAEQVLRQWHIRSTIVVFGSARIREDGPGKQTRWYEQAREFGRIASQRGGALMPYGDARDNVIATGGGPGIMEAANRGAREAGAPTVGFNITLPAEQSPNAYSTPELTFRFHYFAMRKMHLAMRANALAVFPGGFGTFDELFEVLTLTQSQKMRPVPIVLFGRDYWTKVVNFAALAEEGMISEGDLKLFEIVDTPEEGWASLIRRGLSPESEPPLKLSLPPAVGRKRPAARKPRRGG